MKIKANAKINLGLDVVRRREDGYHELNMIMVPIELYDDLDISFALETTLIPNKKYIPTNEKNSIIKVINKLREIYHFDDQFLIHLNKYIPSQAGLGGGSSDAASMIKTLNLLLDLKMSEQDMIDFAKTIGADVPFFITNRPAFVSGIGEKIEPFTINCPFSLLLVKPKMGVSTKVAFETLDFDTLDHPNISLIQKSLIENDYETFISSLGNSLEQSALKLVPEIQKVKDELIELGFDAAIMSGSGSTVFGITRNSSVLYKGEEKMKRKYPFVRKTKIKI